ncbi:hypothetical protein H0H87_007461 [Tephrocybe sp. NHM501043]|nr:hypothetical protein H0H87_007461 [Tephrocybe sp. NHM501043]
MSPTAEPVAPVASNGSAFDAKHPFIKLWRGSKDGSVRMEPMPKFDDPYAEREWIKAHMAAVFRFWGKMGYSNGNAGHITVRDPVLPGYYWMNPLAVHYSSITANSAIHEARPDIKAAAHCHSIYGKAWSVFGKPVEITTQDSCVLYNNLAVYDNFGGVVLATEEGKNIARALGPKNKACILQNHGLLTLGSTVDEAASLFMALDKQCHVMLLAETASSNLLRPKLIDKEDAEYTAKFLQEPEIGYHDFQPEFDLLVEETNGAFLK